MPPHGSMGVAAALLLLCLLQGAASRNTGDFEYVPDPPMGSWLAQPEEHFCPKENTYITSWLLNSNDVPNDPEWPGSYIGYISAKCSDGTILPAITVSNRLRGTKVKTSPAKYGLWTDFSTWDGSWATTFLDVGDGDVHGDFREFSCSSGSAAVGYSAAAFQADNYPANFQIISNFQVICAPIQTCDLLTTVTDPLFKGGNQVVAAPAFVPSIRALSKCARAQGFKIEPVSSARCQPLGATASRHVLGMAIDVNLWLGNTKFEKAAITAAWNKPVTANQRKVKAFINCAGSAGLRLGAKLAVQDANHFDKGPASTPATWAPYYDTLVDFCSGICPALKKVNPNKDACDCNNGI